MGGGEGWEGGEGVLGPQQGELGCHGFMQGGWWKLVIDDSVCVCVSAENELEDRIVALPLSSVPSVVDTCSLPPSLSSLPPFLPSSLPPSLPSLLPPSLPSLLQVPRVFNPGGALSILAVDCGVKYNQLRCLASRGARVRLVPWDYDFSGEEGEGRGEGGKGSGERER